MVRIDLVLQDETELAGFHEFYRALMQRRWHLAKAAEAAQNPPAESAGLKAAMEAAAAAAAPEPAAPEPTAPEPAPEPVDSADPKAVFRDYYQRHGFAAARKKLDAFGAQRFTDIKPEQLPAFLASLHES